MQNTIFLVDFDVCFGMDGMEWRRNFFTGGSVIIAEKWDYFQI